MTQPFTPDMPSDASSTALAAAPAAPRWWAVGRVLAFAALIAAAALAPAIPTPFGVPLTLQTFAVLLAGLVLGPREGAAAAGTYVLAGVAGLPVLAGGVGGPAVLVGPSAGYLLAFPLAAAVAGLLARSAGRGGAWRRFAVLAGAALAGGLVVHLVGVVVLAVRLGWPPAQAVAADAIFLPGDALKALLAASAATGVALGRKTTRGASRAD